MSSGVVIAGVYSQTEGGPPAPGNEYVVLINTSDWPISLTGWSLTNLKRDRVHHYRYLFPRSLSDGSDWTFAPGNMAIVHTGRGRSCRMGESQYYLYQHRTVSVWAEQGDVVCLHDRNGLVVSSFVVPGVRQSA
jgi:hypothetical protein